MITIKLTQNAKAFKVIEQASRIAQKILSMPEFYQAIAAKKTPFDSRWTSPQATNEFIAKFFFELEVEMTVDTYYKRFSKAFAYTLTGVKGKLWINTSKLNRSIPSIVATIIHECCHLVDFESEYNMHHGDNDPRGKQNSFPYWTDDLAYKMAEMILKDLPIDFIEDEDDSNNNDVQYAPYYPWYKKAWWWLKRKL